MVSEATKRAVKKYISEKTDEIKVRVPKGKKAEYMQLAADQGQSLNAVINRLLQEWQQIATNNNK
jgi:predicted HicB family RNase H-like nuclease